MKRAAFYEDVYEVVRLIPKGRVTSYGAIAHYLGAKGSSRMVGYAMSAAAAMPDVPAHRVVNRDGLLTGKFHFGSGNEMQMLLEAEGIDVQDNKIINFSAFFWDPSLALNL